MNTTMSGTIFGKEIGIVYRRLGLSKCDNTLAVARMGVIVAGALARMDPETAEGAPNSQQNGRARTASRVHDLAEAAEASLGRPVI